MRAQGQGENPAGGICGQGGSLAADDGQIEKLDQIFEQMGLEVSSGAAGDVGLVGQLPRPDPLEWDGEHDDERRWVARS